MKRFFLFSCLLCALFWTGADALAGQGYSRVIDDLPLMTGMREDAGQSIVFDTPQGRIVQAVAETETTAADVLKFYDQSLPPLGWVAGQGAGQNIDNVRIFYRAQERLTVTAQAAGGGVRVSFDLSPVAAE